MRSTLSILLFTLVSSLAAQTPVQPQRGQTVQGVVLRDGTAEPIAGAEVTLTVESAEKAAASLMNLAASFGMPLPNIEVHAFTRAFQNGSAVLQSVANNKTEPDGAFRLSWLDPGEYFLAAIPSSLGRRSDRGNDCRIGSAHRAVYFGCPRASERRRKAEQRAI